MGENSAPAGWFPQTDGRLRRWDGTEWTDEFRAAPTDADPGPGAAPLPPEAPAAIEPEGKKKNWFLRHKILSALGLIALIVIAINIGSGGDDDETPAASGGAPSSATATPTGSPPGSASAEPTAADAADTTGTYDEMFGTFTAITKSGTGDDVIALPDGARVGVVTMTHSGSSNFAVSTLDSENQETGDLLANEIGKYKGVSAYGLNGLGGEPTKLKLTADGKWTIKVAPASSAPLLAANAKGTGANVFRYDGEAADWKLTHNGESNFSVLQVSDALMPNLAVNEIGDYSGTVPFDAGPSVIQIGADGKWTAVRQ